MKSFFRNTLIAGGLLLVLVAARTGTEGQRQGMDEGIRSAARDSISSFRQALIGADAERCGKLFLYFQSLLSGDLLKDSLLISDAYYYMGAQAYRDSDNNLSLLYFSNSVRYRQGLGMRDRIYRNALTNTGSALFYMGRFGEAIALYDSLIVFVKEEDGPYALANVTNYNNLASAYNELKIYDKAISAAHNGLEIADRLDPGPIILNLVSLYNNLGISYSRQSDYSRANLYMRKAYEIIAENPEMDASLYLNVLNSLIVINNRLGYTDDAEAYYKTALPVAMENKGESSFLLISNYATDVAAQGNIPRADSIMNDILDRFLPAYAASSRLRYEILEKYVSFLARFRLDNERAFRILNDELLPYSLANPSDIVLIRDIRHAQAVLLRNEGKLRQALASIQDALFVKPDDGITPEFDNPAFDRFIPDRTGLAIKNEKVNILRELYSQTGDTLYLTQAVEANRSLIAAIEMVRIGISEEESRILLGDDYRKVYDGIVADLHALYSVSGQNRHFSMAFEYAERGKAAGLLVSLREVKAIQFLIPDSLALLERDYERRLGLTREMIARELAARQPDQDGVRLLRDREYAITEDRNELIAYFERQYPDYYAAKYNTSVAGANDIRRKAGRKSSYINYIYADTVLYIFVVNKKHNALVTVSLEPCFQERLEEFRSLLLKPLQDDDSRAMFNSYCETGYYLYGKLIAPVRDLIHSGRLIISPDNILTYIPFEALLTTRHKRDDLLYRELDLLLNDFEISYTYSATMFLETGGQYRSFRNPALALAPHYPGMIYVDSILDTRHTRQNVLYDLPFARDEAAYVVSMLGGELYLNEGAVESVYKKRASKFPVIHFAMHTIINDESPGYSKLIFSGSTDDPEDGLLNTYEIYGTHINAGMVVVSSCNTGTGQLRAGEGVMSLARGFINAGGRSVVMSLWEVDDEWGSSVMKLFYNNLMKGMSKSKALKKAKLSMVNDGQQLLGHPYYWSTLVLYGNQEALFYDYKVLAAYLLIVVAVIAAAVRILFYFKSS